MPLGVVTDEVFAEELTRALILPTSAQFPVPTNDEDEVEEVEPETIHKDMKRGRGAVAAVPPFIREIIAEETICTDKTQKEIAEEFGVSPSSVSAYVHGATSTASYNAPDKKLKTRNDLVRSQIISTARSRLLQALTHITPEKLKDAKVRDIASVAKDMSAVIANHEPKIIEQTSNVGAQFIFHVPKQKVEADFDIIDVGA